MFTALLWTGCAVAVVTTALVLWNLALYRAPEEAGDDDRLVSVLIPARDEEANIVAALTAVLASRHARLEVLVLDDHSSDRTAALAAEIARRDRRVRVLAGAPLPPNACGKPHACAQLADAANGDVLIFVDADVRLAPDAVGRIAALPKHAGAALVSGVPRQITRTPSERLLVPLIDFVLLGHLPIAAARRLRWPAFGAACGQLVAVEREPYAACGGHRAIPTTFHDGVALARRFRACGFRTDLSDLTGLAQCRMYSGFRSVVAGFAKNAHEGLGSAAAIVPWSLLLLAGQVLPVAALLGLALAGTPGDALARGASPPAGAVVDEGFLPAALGTFAAYAGRIALGLRFRHDRLGMLLHPLGVAALVGVQWYALLRRLRRRPVGWKGRPPVVGARPRGS